MDSFFFIEWIDAVVLLIYLLGVVALGVWISRGQKDVHDYLLGGRNLPWWAVLGSIVATETSTVTFLSVPGIAYAAGGDFRFLQLAFGYIIGRVLVVFILLPNYFRGELYSAYQVLHRRFGGATKNVASLLFIVMRTLADGLRLYLTAIVLDRMVGLPLPLCVAVIGIVTMIYTFFGGMKSVVWNDCIQLVIYLLGAVLAAGVILWTLPGGLEQLVEYARAHEKLRLFDFGYDAADPYEFWTRPYTFWAGLIGGAFLSLASHGADQLMVQRYLCARSQPDAALALTLSGFFVCAQFALFLLLGVGLAAFYDYLPPATPFDKNDEVFAAFIVDHLPVGITGLVLAAVFAAAMSTLSSSLNSSATAAVNDLYQPLRRKPPSQQHLLRVSRALTIVFGILQIVVASAAPLVLSLFTQRAAAAVVDSVLAIAGFTTGVLLGLFFLGTATERTSQRAALTGLVAGLAILTIIKFGGFVVAWPAVERITHAGLVEVLQLAQKLAWPWLTVIGTISTCVIGYAASFLWPQPHFTAADTEVHRER